MYSILRPNDTTFLCLYSKSCQHTSAVLEAFSKLSARRSDLRCCTADIDMPGANEIDFQSPLARQFELHTVPSFVVYKGTTKTAAGYAARAWVIQEMIESGIVRASDSELE